MNKKNKKILGIAMLASVFPIVFGTIGVDAPWGVGSGILLGLGINAIVAIIYIALKLID